MPARVGQPRLELGEEVDIQGTGSAGSIPQLRVALIGVLQTSAPTTVTVACVTPTLATYPIASSQIVATAVGTVH